MHNVLLLIKKQAMTKTQQLHYLLDTHENELIKFASLKENAHLEIDDLMREFLYQLLDKLGQRNNFSYGAVYYAVQNYKFPQTRIINSQEVESITEARKEFEKATGMNLPIWAELLSAAIFIGIMLIAFAVIFAIVGAIL